MSEALTIFKAINEESEKNLILQKILKHQDAIYIQDKSNRKLVLKAKAIGPKRTLECFPLEESGPAQFDTSTYTANITLQGESYIFDTRPEFCTDHIKLPVFNLFHIQKRKNYRYVLPADYSGKFVFSTLSNPSTEIHCRLLDISTDGCAVEIGLENANVNVQDKLEGAIILGHREPLLVQGYIQNIRPVGETLLVLGVEFDHNTKNSEGLIITSITNLQRELYFRKKTA